MAFDIIPGSVSDITTLKRFASDMNSRVPGCTLIMDRGFESAGNIADMMQSGIDFVMPCTVSSKAVKKLLKEVNARFTTRTFSCENDVSREIEDVLKKHRDSAYDVEYDITSIRIQKKREKRGCPPKRWIHKFDT